MAEVNSNTLSPAEQMAMGPRMRREKKLADKQSSVEESPEQEGESSFREKIMAARNALNVKKNIKGKIEDKMLAPARIGMNRLLQQAWIHLISSWGLTLIYINLHAFLRLIFPKLFCELGGEWYPEQLKKMLEKAGIKSGAAIKVGEKMLLVILDILLLIALAILFSVLKFIYEHAVLSWALEKILL